MILDEDSDLENDENFNDPAFLLIPTKTTTNTYRKANALILRNNQNFRSLDLWILS